MEAVGPLPELVQNWAELLPVEARRFVAALRRLWIVGYFGEKIRWILGDAKSRYGLAHGDGSVVVNAIAAEAQPEA